MQQPLPLPTRESVGSAAAEPRDLEGSRAPGDSGGDGDLPMPTDAQRRNDISGEAYKQRQAQGQKGSFHFVDSHDLMIERMGVILEDLMDKVLDTARDVPVRKPDDTARSCGSTIPRAAVRRPAAALGRSDFHQGRLPRDGVDRAGDREPARRGAGLRRWADVEPRRDRRSSPGRSAR
jgi:hypothetical protein